MNDKRLRLDAIFDDCIIQHTDTHYVYSAEKVIDVLFDQFCDLIKRGEVPLYDDDDTIEESAIMYAYEDFDFNFEGYKMNGAPVYLWTSDDHKGVDA